MRIHALIAVATVAVLGACGPDETATHSGQAVVATASGAARVTVPDGWVSTRDEDAVTLRHRGRGDRAIIVVRETSMAGRGLDAAARDTIDHVREGLHPVHDWARRAADITLDDGREAFVLHGRRGTGDHEHEIYQVGFVVGTELLTVALDDPPPPPDDPADNSGHDAVRRVLHDVELSDAS